VAVIDIEELSVNLRPGTSLPGSQEPKNRLAQWFSRRKQRKSIGLGQTTSGILTGLHYHAIHAIRKFMVDGHLLSESALEQEPASFESLANDCRNALAIAIGRDPKKIHCSIKLCEGTKNIPQADWLIWTLTRSELLTTEPFTLRNQFGPGSAQMTKDNSAYAALTGCSDSKTEWGGRKVYSCFSCNDLTNHNDKYVNSRTNWPDFYKAALVFPLRWNKSRKSTIEVKGFLSFDSLIPEYFPGIPCIYECEYIDYFRELINSVAYHTGGIMADVLATAIALQDTDDSG
jgi:hypothetical protein